MSRDYLDDLLKQGGCLTWAVYCPGFIGKRSLAINRKQELLINLNYYGKNSNKYGELGLSTL